MMVAKMRMKFMITKTVCNFPIILDIREARTPWHRTQARKTPYIAPLDGVQFPSRATTMTERNMRAKPSAKHYYNGGDWGTKKPSNPHSLSNKDHPQDRWYYCSQLGSKEGCVSSPMQNSVSTSTTLPKLAWTTLDQPGKSQHGSVGTNCRSSHTIAKPTTNIRPEAKNQPCDQSTRCSIVFTIAWSHEPKPFLQGQQGWNTLESRLSMVRGP